MNNTSDSLYETYLKVINNKNLSNEQKEKIEDILGKYIRELGNLFEEIKDLCLVGISEGMELIKKKTEDNSIGN